jgi:hypothetical protein
MFTDCQFPLFEIRGYIDLFYEGNYRCIQTNKTRWVLDYKHKTDESYARRRIQLKTDAFRPYRVYPLYKMHSRAGSLMRSKHREFIDSRGKLIKPQKFYKIHIARIRASWITLTGNRAYRVLETSRTFVAEDGEFTHLCYIKIGKRRVLYDLLHKEDLPDYSSIRIKL